MLGFSREASQSLQSWYRAHRTGAMMEFSILPVVFSLKMPKALCAGSESSCSREDICSADLDRLNLDRLNIDREAQLSVSILARELSALAGTKY